MSSAKITTIGFYNFLNASNDDLFKLLVVPTGIDKQVLIDNILLRGGEFEVLYSDPYFYQNAIGVWSNKWQRTMQKWVEALAIEYSPLENYDRMEEWTDKNTGTVKNTGTIDTENHTDTDITNDDKISAFNSDTMRDNTSSHGVTDGNSNGTTTNDLTETNDLTGHHVGRVHGNIGVTTSMQLLEAQLDIVAWNVYEHITDLFLNEFVIPIYD